MFEIHQIPAHYYSSDLLMIDLHTTYDLKPVFTQRWGASMTFGTSANVLSAAAEELREKEGLES